MTEDPTLRTQGEEQSRQLALFLKGYLKTHRTTASAVSQALGHAPQYLTLVFSGAVPLKLKDLFGALAALEPHPHAFFDRYFAARSGAAHAPSTGPLAKLHELAARSPRPRYRRSPDETTDQAGLQLAAWIVGAGMKQRPISRALGLKADTLAKALRNDTHLTTWHTFAVLAAIGKEPADFFEELLATEEPDGLSQEDARLLTKVLEATLAGLKARAQPETSTGRVAAKTAKKGAGRKGTTKPMPPATRPPNGKKKPTSDKANGKKKR